MADRTVRAIFEARVSGAQKGMRALAGDVDKAGKKVDGLAKDLKGLDGQKVTPKIDVAIDAAKKRISDITVELGVLRTLEVTPAVTANIKEAQKKLREARAELKDLNSAKAELRVTADTAPAKKEVAALEDDIGQAGAQGGDKAGLGVVGGILDALRTIPIAGAVIGVGVAIAGGILVGLKQGLQIEAERDLFSAQTGLDEKTSARFGRAAGEAYANAWGDSVASNLDTAKMALKGGLIDSRSTDAEIQNVIAKLTGITDLFDYDVTSAVRAVGNAMKTGLVKDANQAFDLITVASQKVPSDDLLDTINEYSNQLVQLGLSGPKAIGLLVQGVKAGARDTDNVADTIKELGLRVREDTKTSATALRLLGLRGDEMAAAFDKGGPAAVKAIGLILDRLRELREKGGNTQSVITNLFGGPGEDLGAAIFALDVDTANRALGGVAKSAGAADRALATMSDNTSSKIESAKRNIETAVDGIRGALAEAFGGDIAGAADYISKNRAVLLEFFQQVLDGTFEMGRSFLTFSATALDSIAEVIMGMADLIDSLPGDQSELKASLYGIADGLKDGAKVIRGDFIPALDEAQEKADKWIAPEILKARTHDATVAMAADMDAFSDKVAATGGTVTINGDKLNAEEALAELVDKINAEDGTIRIDGDNVPAEDALDAIMRSIDLAEADITVGADTRRAGVSVKEARGRISATEASLTVVADTSPAERALQLLRKKYARLDIRVAGVNAPGGQVSGNHAGGRVMRGLYAGGRVPGVDPGYDNVLWPLNVGGRTLQQPLAGGEYVVNSKDAAQNLALLEAINSGSRPSVFNETRQTPVFVTGPVTVGTLGEVAAKAEAAAWRRAVGRQQ